MAKDHTRFRDSLTLLGRQEQPDPTGQAGEIFDLIAGDQPAVREIIKGIAVIVAITRDQHRRFLSAHSAGRQITDDDPGLGRKIVPVADLFSAPEDAFREKIESVCVTVGRSCKSPSRQAVGDGLHRSPANSSKGFLGLVEQHHGVFRNSVPPDAVFDLVPGDQCAIRQAIQGIGIIVILPCNRPCGVGGGYRVGADQKDLIFPRAIKNGCQFRVGFKPARSNIRVIRPCGTQSRFRSFKVLGAFFPAAVIRVNPSIGSPIGDLAMGKHGSIVQSVDTGQGVDENSDGPVLLLCNRSVVVSNQFDGEGNIADVRLASPKAHPGVIRDVALIECAVGATVSRDHIVGVSAVGAPPTDTLTFQNGIERASKSGFRGVYNDVFCFFPRNFFVLPLNVGALVNNGSLKGRSLRAAVTRPCRHRQGQ
jgi:hypothetical protein